MMLGDLGGFFDDVMTFDLGWDLFGLNFHFYFYLGFVYSARLR
jgi:hypothetical protein